MTTTLTLSVSTSPKGGKLTDPTVSWTAKEDFATALRELADQLEIQSKNETTNLSNGWFGFDDGAQGSWEIFGMVDGEGKVITE